MIILKKSSDTGARAGKIITGHGEVDTPVFMPVATSAAVKTVSNEELRGLGAQMFVSNTYHLYLRPGIEVIKAAGGLHRFMNWDRSILTDSGGYQVYSMSTIRKITEEGVKFQSHIDGSPHMFTPEFATELQLLLGSDIAMCFDECAPYPCTYDYAGQSMEMTLRWAERCKRTFVSLKPQGSSSMLFGITQGSTYRDLRIESAKKTVDIGFDGYAVGGLAVGEPDEVTREIVSYVTPLLPEDKPRYAMGVGSIGQVWDCIENGIDVFDCVLPTRNGRNGHAFTFSGKINLKNARFQRDFVPVEEDCGCPACMEYTRAYIHHLFRAGELLALRLLSLHNIYFMLKFFSFVRKSISENRFLEAKKEFYSKYAES
jgi:queuine tRNA-ribosyltransferase